MHTNLILLFKQALYSSTLMIKLFKKLYEVVLSRNSYRNTIGWSCFISSATGMARPLLKLKCSLCLVSNVQLVKHLLL